MLGETARIPVDDTYIQSGDIGLVIPNEEVLDKSFAYYLIASPLVKKQLDAAAQQTKIRHTSPEKIKDCEVWLPKIKHQIKTGEILDAINAKIENNNEINVQLESMAKTIYDYWFIQFDFPNENGKPYKSSGGKMVWNEKLKREIPEGWEAKRLGDIFEFIKGKIPNELSNTKEEGKEEYLTIEALNDAIAQYCNPEAMPITEGNVLMVMDGAASSEVYVGNKGVIGSTLCKLEIRDEYIKNNFLYVIMKKYESIFKKVNTGSTVPHANKNYINDVYICLPMEQNIRNMLQQDINLLINKIIQNKKQNRELTSLRDFLLPLLMNGQVGFKED